DVDYANSENLLIKFDGLFGIRNCEKRCQTAGTFWYAIIGVFSVCMYRHVFEVKSKNMLKLVDLRQIDRQIRIHCHGRQFSARTRRTLSCTLTNISSLSCSRTACCLCALVLDSGVESPSRAD